MLEVLRKLASFSTIQDYDLTANGGMCSGETLLSSESFVARQQNAQLSKPQIVQLHLVQDNLALRAEVKSPDIFCDHRPDGQLEPERSDAEVAVTFRGSKRRSCSTFAGTRRGETDEAARGIFGSQFLSSFEPRSS